MNMNKNDGALSDTQHRRSKPHNLYNIFFMLERQLLVQETERLSGIAAADKNQQPLYDLGGYDPRSTTTISELASATGMVCAREKLQT